MFTRLICVATTFALVAGGIHAMPLHPDVIERLREEGRLDPATRAMSQARAKGVNRPNPNAPRWNFEAKQIDQPSIVILVEFADHPSDSTPAHYEDMLFSEGTYPSGSMRDYYLENSYGQLGIIGTVTLWLMMPHPYAYYVDGQRGFGDYPQNAQKLAEDAVLAADPYVDFSQFDADGDGYVDALFVVHAGWGYEETGNPDDIHSHAWAVTYDIPVDGVYARTYSMEPENGRIGVFCHELGHVFGLPDLYDYDYDSRGVGYWSAMASGSWGNSGRTPVHLDGWSKSYLGFVDLVVPTSDLTEVGIPEVETSPVVYKLWTDGTPGSEYFIVENRQKTRFDAYLKGNGLVIYHVDENVWNNNNQWYPGHTESGHYRVAVEQADGRWDLERNVNSGDFGDAWPGMTFNRTFRDGSTPDSKDYDFEPSHVGVVNIGNSADTMTADLVVARYGVAVSAGRDTIGVSGGDAEVSFSVLNASIHPDTFSLVATDDQGWPLTPDSMEIFLPGGTDSVLTLILSIPPGIAIGTIDTISAIATSSEDPSLSDSASLTVTVEAACGDCNGDGVSSIADATYIVSYIYREGPVPVGDGDVNLDGRTTIADANYIVSYIYRGGLPPCSLASGELPDRQEKYMEK